MQPDLQKFSLYRRSFLYALAACLLSIQDHPQPIPAEDRLLTVEGAGGRLGTSEALRGNSSSSALEKA
jgi:hypothetical protein